MISHAYKFAVKYSQNNALQYSFAMSLLSKLSINKTSRILDIGCGDGRITSQLAKNTLKGVIGTDLSTKMVNFASSTYASTPNLKFVTMDASQNIFHNQFDIVTSFNCLHWVKDQGAALRGIYESVVPGGQVMLLLSHRKSLYHRVIDDVTSMERWNQYFPKESSPRSFFTKESYEHLLTDSGLTVNSLNEEEMFYMFDNQIQIREFYNAAGSQVQLVPEEQREEFLNDFSTEFVRRSELTSTGKIPMSFWCLQVLAKRPLYALDNTQENSSSFFVK